MKIDRKCIYSTNKTEVNESQPASTWTVCTKQNAALLNLFLLTQFHFSFFSFSFLNPVVTTEVPIQSIFFLLLFLFLNNLSRLSLTMCQTVAVELVQHLTPFTKALNCDSCYFGEGSRKIGNFWGAPRRWRASAFGFYPTECPEQN